MSARGPTGRWIEAKPHGGETVRSFLPHPLPPEPPLAVSSPLRILLDEALVALGRLDSVSLLLPEPTIFLYSYVRKEAVLSSQIEGTSSTLSNLLFFELEEAPGVPIDDVAQVSTYVAALEHGLSRLRDGFPLVNRLLCELHARLLTSGRGKEKDAGSFRRSQNWIGGTRPGNASFVPPPAQDVADCMAALESFLHDRPVMTPPLLKAALAHVQFETIHPFLDGNGRLGRMLIALILVEQKVLRAPLLYLSLWLKQHRSTYYELLQRVRTHGEWEEWVEFFAQGTRDTAAQVTGSVQKLATLFRKDRERIAAIGKRASIVLRVHEAMQRRPLVSITSLASELQSTHPTVNQALARLVDLGIAREATGRKRNRVFAYAEYLRVLEEGTSEPPG